MQRFFSIVEAIGGALGYFLIAGFLGCASFAEIDQDGLNHPAMDLKNPRTPRPQTPLSQLNSAEGAQGGGCSSCAK